MKGFAIHNAPTDHGGRIPSTQMRESQEGNLFVRAGDGHFCPKCKVWSTVQPSHNHVIFDGKPVAYVDDILSCGAKILPQQSHVVGESQGANYSTSSKSSTQPVISQQNQTNSLLDENKQSRRVNNIAYYKWWWGGLESKNPETSKQEHRSFSENFDAMHHQYAYGTEAIDYEIDPKAWDAEVAFEILPDVIQRSVDKNGDIGTALAKMTEGESIENFEWRNLGFGQDYYKTVTTKQWPLGRLACVAYGTLTKLGKDAMGKPNFQFVGYLKVESDTYSWNTDIGNVIKKLGIFVMGEAVEASTGKKTGSEVYKKTDYEMPTIYMRKFHFDYKKDSTKTPLLSR